MSSKNAQTRHRARHALIALCIGAVPLTVLAEASSPTTSDAQTGTPMHSTTHAKHKKTGSSTDVRPNSTGGASNAPNKMGGHAGVPDANGGDSTAPQNGAGSSN